MSLIICVGAADGVVIASDSASTHLDTGSKRLVNDKLKQVRNLPMVYGGGGESGLLQHLNEIIQNTEFTLSNSVREIQTGTR